LNFKIITMKKNYFSLTILFAFFYQFIFAQPGNFTFNSSGTYTVPAGFSAIVTIEAWGGGAGGGSGAGAKGGGGGGAYSSLSTTLIAGSYAVTVGAGGAEGVNGGNSSFTTLVIAAGGTSTTTFTGGAGGTVAASTGTTRFAGGTGGTAGNGNSSGAGGGGSATSSAVGNNGGVGTNGAGQTGGAGGTGQGPGGAGANNTAGATPIGGSVPGGGGGGKSNTGVATSAAGGGGRVIVTVNTVLSIKINYFNASKGNGVNTLNWLASCTSTQAIFEIERSSDGRNFTSINTITATQERCAQPFTFADNANLTGPVYYRIKSIDIDGGAKYSATIKLGDLPKNRQLTAVLPNPVSDRAQLNISASKKDRVELSVFSIEGKMVQRNIIDLQAGTSIINLDVVNLQKGVYTVRGVFSDGQTGSIKFVKQ
jgi:Secretion system C-terminal sorting domain